ncbi:MAG: methylated-DNA--[protein]-cysteine S-methyltransferase [Enterococcaceae bacterium]|jgi:methylated-DNA-[protein]-cysteine S-methyltransferase|nr:methylated-DNA--[protein]-cysteine S-methyltransferase [Enterococcaceae bacterium]
MSYYDTYTSPLGEMIMTSNGDALTRLAFNGQKYLREDETAELTQKELPIFQETKKWLDLYFAGKHPDFTPALAPSGTPFREEVWKILLTVPYGKTITYGEIAKRMVADHGKEKMSAQAVGGAVGHNPIDLIIPCHRVVGKNGSLTGYAGGLDKKIDLLSLEKTDMKKLFMPKS